MGREKTLQGLKAEDKVKKCPECGSIKVEYDNNELVCKKCGLVIED